MEEVKFRIELIQKSTSGTFGFPPLITQEFCYLQIRMICELVAVGCLVAHGDIVEAKRLKKEFSAGRIINQLEKLHSDFYPHACKQVKVQENVFHLEKVTEVYMGKEELVALYNKCGDFLHRGSLKKLLSGKQPIQKNFPDIVAAVNKLAILLNFHRISLADGDTQIICMLRNKDNQNRVQVVIAEADKQRC